MEKEGKSILRKKLNDDFVLPDGNLSELRVFLFSGDDFEKSCNVFG